MRIPEFIRTRLAGWAFKLMANRQCDFIIRPSLIDQTYRWWIIPRNKWFNIYLHKWVSSDEARALHDHPWKFNASILIHGSYIEHTLYKNPRRVNEGEIVFRRGAAPHRIELDQAGWSMPCDKYPKGEMLFEHCVTIFITGRKFREWGFLCPKGWRHWEDFCDKRDHGIIGRGCE